MTASDKIFITAWGCIICGNAWAAVGNGLGMAGFLALGLIGLILSWRARK